MSEVFEVTGGDPTGGGRESVLVEGSPEAICALEEFLEEFNKAMDLFPAMASPHEGYAVIQEEVDELWDEIKGNCGRAWTARDEALQVAAMGLRYVMDLTEE